MSERLLTVASAWMNSARWLDEHPSLPPLPLHGHRFQVSVMADMQGLSLLQPGGETVHLKNRLAQVLEGLDGGCLNDRIDQPSDDALASWVSNGLEMNRLRRVAVMSTPWQGIDHLPGQANQAWRRYRFQAAHQLPCVPLGHKCGRMHGHGFEAVLHLSLAPGQDARSAWHALDQAWAPWHMQLNYQTLNDIEGLENPTSEMLSSWLWDKLQPALPLLASVTVYETPTSGANFNGEQYRIWKDFSFDSATRWRHAPADSPLARVHGHTYQLRLGICAPLDQVMGWTLDYGDVKALFKPVFDAVDHHPLHEWSHLSDGDTGSLARWIANQTQTELPQIDHLALYENAGCGSWLQLNPQAPVLPVGANE